DVATGQEENRINDLWRDARIGWSKARTEIEEQIQSARVQRQKEELETLEWERERAARDRDRRFGFGSGFSFIALAFGSYLTYLVARQTAGKTSTSYWNWLTDKPFGVLLILAALAGVPLIWLFLFGGSTKALWGRVRSLRELDDLAAALNRARH